MAQYRLTVQQNAHRGAGESHIQTVILTTVYRPGNFRINRPSILAGVVTDDYLISIGRNRGKLKVRTAVPVKNISGSAMGV